MQTLLDIPLDFFMIVWGLPSASWPSRHKRGRNTHRTSGWYSTFSCRPAVFCCSSHTVDNWMAVYYALELFIDCIWAVMAVSRCCEEWYSFCKKSRAVHRSSRYNIDLRYLQMDAIWTYDSWSMLVPVCNQNRNSNADSCCRVQSLTWTLITFGMCFAEGSTCTDARVPRMCGVPYSRPWAVQLDFLHSKISRPLMNLLGLPRIPVDTTDFSFDKCSRKKNCCLRLALFCVNCW